MRTGGARRGRAERSEPEHAVLMHPAFVESAQLDWFDDPEKRSYLLSLFSYYPVAGEVMLAVRPRRRVVAYMDELVDGGSRKSIGSCLTTEAPRSPSRSGSTGGSRRMGTA